MRSSSCRGRLVPPRRSFKSRYQFEPVKKIVRRYSVGQSIEPVEKIVRRYSVVQSMALFLRDGFIDRYTGNRLINPGVLRLLHVVLRDDFPAHPNWKASETHIAFWGIPPVSRSPRASQSRWERRRAELGHSVDGEQPG